MSLEPTFALTPRESCHLGDAGPEGENDAFFYVFGATMLPKWTAGYRQAFDPQHASDELYFHWARAADPTADYSSYDARTAAPHIFLRYNLSAFSPHKELALFFHFDVETEARVLVYSKAGQLFDETLHPGDEQFLIEVESTSSMDLFFVHARNPNSSYGGNWYFRGITGYVV